MLGRDAFYTPHAIAAQMVAASSKRPKVVADFTAGEGELLRAAANRWPKAQLIATDISEKALATLKKTVMVTSSGKCDLLSKRSSANCGALKCRKGQIDLVLLNPPFSCRGGKRILVSTDQFNTSCSTAMAFALLAFEFLKPHGEMIAILPAGSFTSEKDREAWRQLSEIANVKRVSHHGYRTFRSCYPSTQIVRIVRLKIRRQKPVRLMVPLPRADTVGTNAVVIHRGKIQMHSIPPGDTPLAHSTDLRNFRLSPNGYRTRSGFSAIKGHFVAICRVGSPKKEKVALCCFQSDVAVSDCIVAMGCDDERTASILHASIIENWPSFAALYGGTGAKYITVQKLVSFVKLLGFSVIAPAGAEWQLKRSIESLL